MSHDHGDLIVGEVEFVQNAMKESDLSTGHAKRIDLVRANQVDLPVPISGAGVPLVAERNQLHGDVTQANHLWVVVGCQCVFFRCLLEHLAVLGVSTAFHFGGWHQFGKARLLAHLHPISGERVQAVRTGHAKGAVMKKSTFGQHKWGWLGGDDNTRV